MNTDLIIVGGGPAGLMAACSAADSNINCTVIEKMPKPARKLGISGKGRGNLTNTTELREFLLHFNNYGRFLKPAFNQFFNLDLIRFFNQIGVKTVEERGKRIFTASGKAPEAANKLIKAVESRGVKILSETNVESLIIENGKCKGVVISGNKLVKSSATILATGGKSYPLTGSNGTGFKLAKETGHKIITPLPALVPLLPAPPLPSYLNGLTLKNVKAELYADNKLCQSEFGEITFQDNYLAGPIILTLSRRTVYEISQGKETEIRIDLKPALSYKKLENRILREIDKNSKISCFELTRKLLPGKFAKYFNDLLNLSAKTFIAKPGSQQRRNIRNLLKSISFSIVNNAGWDQAIITQGGISCRDIKSRTMESRIVQNLFFAGELIDIDADTGGFNLQAAFSTGWLAGKSAADQIGKEK